MFFTYVVGIDDQLNDVLWVHVEDFNCRSRNEGSIILQRGKKTQNKNTQGELLHDQINNNMH